MAAEKESGGAGEQRSRGARERRCKGAEVQRQLRSVEWEVRSVGACAHHSGEPRIGFGAGARIQLNNGSMLLRVLRPFVASEPVSDVNGNSPYRFLTLDAGHWTGSILLVTHYPLLITVLQHLDAPVSSTGQALLNTKQNKISQGKLIKSGMTSVKTFNRRGHRERRGNHKQGERQDYLT